MFALIRPFVQLCLFQTEPQRLPASTLLLALALIAHILAETMGFAMLLDPPTAFLAGLTGTVLLIALTASVLLVQRQQARIVQTVTALAGSITLLDLVGLSVLSWREAAHASGSDQGLPILALLVLTAWSLGVQGHILRHALSVPFFIGILVSIFFFWITLNVMRYLFLFGA